VRWNFTLLQIFKTLIILEYLQVLNICNGIKYIILKRLENPKLSRLFFRLTAFHPAYDARIIAQNAPCQAKIFPGILQAFQVV